MSNNEALARWVSVHQSFFVYIQAILFKVAEYDKCSKASAESAELDIVLSDIALLLRASAAAMRLAGSMSKETYQSVVQPNMAGLDPNFSGLFSADHQEMIQSLIKLRGMQHSGHGHILVQEAIRHCYEAHARVCELFVGIAPSLAGKKAGDASVSGVEELRTKYLRRTLARIAPPIEIK